MLVGLNVVLLVPHPYPLQAISLTHHETYHSHSLLNLHPMAIHFVVQPHHLPWSPYTQDLQSLQWHTHPLLDKSDDQSQPHMLSHSTEQSTDDGTLRTRVFSRSVTGINPSCLGSCLTQNTAACNSTRH